MSIWQIAFGGPTTFHLISIVKGLRCTNKFLDTARNTIGFAVLLGFGGSCFSTFFLGFSAFWLGPLNAELCNSM